MYEPPFTYPEVHRGDEIEFAPTEKTPDPHWILGKVLRTKTGSIDVRAGDRTFTDVRHIGDPFLINCPPRASSGVFRLCNNQVRLNRMFADHEAMKRRMDALEATFRAVMGSQGDCETTTPAGRRSARQAGVPG